MNEQVDRLNEIAARWEHGHAELTAGCALCNAEWAEVFAVIHGPDTGTPDDPMDCMDRPTFQLTWCVLASVLCGAVASGLLVSAGVLMFLSSSSAAGIAIGALIVLAGGLLTALSVKWVDR